MSSIKERWIDAYRDKGALWISDGNPERPHALLTSGKHSNGFFNSVLVTDDPALLKRAVSALLTKVSHTETAPDRVVGPAMGAITLAYEVASVLGRGCLSGYAEKGADHNDVERKFMVFNKTKIIPGEKILVVEDVLTTGGSVERLVEAVVRADGIILPYVLVLVNRSGLTEVGGKKIISLIDEEMPIWEADECPLCKKSSTALRPREGDNWVKLNGNY
jgi:orotate phosphoribosyltransferase